MIINTGGTKSLCKRLLKIGTCFLSACVKALLNCASIFFGILRHYERYFHVVPEENTASIIFTVG